MLVYKPLNLFKINCCLLWKENFVSYKVSSCRNAEYGKIEVLCMIADL